MVITGFEKIEKEMISDLKFPESDVLKNSRQISARKSDLQRVITTSSLDNSTIKIYFEDDDSRKVVETTVWAMTDKRVILKQSIGIPINRIHSVKL